MLQIAGQKLCGFVVCFVSASATVVHVKSRHDTNPRIKEPARQAASAAKEIEREHGG
jgi:hypothetical protein